MSQTFQIEKIEDWQKVVDEILPNLQHNILLLIKN
jgi:tRNA threonylcarbamoyladenosine biosynthesis protein TsaE